MMAGGYFTDDQNDKMKTLLYPYLMDKFQRRAKQTSGAAYDAREAGYRQDENNSDARGLVSVLGDSASMAGTLQGKRSDVGQLPKYMDQLTDNDQQRNANLFKERAAEENSLGTDLGVAKFVGDEDYKDKDLKARTADREADRQAKLNAYLMAEREKQAAQAQHDKEFGMTYAQRERERQGREGLGREGLRLREKQIDKAPPPGADKQAAFDQRERFHQDAMDLQREKMNKPKGGGALSEKQMEKINDFDDGLDMLKGIMTQKRSVHTGPAEDLRNRAAQKVGIDDPKVSTFRADVQDRLAQYVHKISGAASSDKERAFLYQNVPAMGDNDATFMMKANNLLSHLSKNRERYVTGLAKIGKDPTAFMTPPASGGNTKKSVDDMSDEEVDANLRSRSLIK